MRSRTLLVRGDMLHDLFINHYRLASCLLFGKGKLLFAQSAKLHNDTG